MNRRRNNLILFKVKENERTPSDLRKVVLELFRDHVDGDFNVINFDEDFRIGQKKPNVIRLIVVSFMSIINVLKLV